MIFLSGPSSMFDIFLMFGLWIGIPIAIIYFILVFIRGKKK
jgi:hypothetical protein